MAQKICCGGFELGEGLELNGRTLKATGGEASKFKVTYLNIEAEFSDEADYPYLTNNEEKISADQLIDFINSGTVYINLVKNGFDYAGIVTHIITTNYGLVTLVRANGVDIPAFTSEWTYEQIDEFYNDWGF